MLQNIAQILLWISVIAWSLWFGALMYEIFVVMPLWSSSPPVSVVEWNARPQYIINPTKYYVPVALACILSAIGALITAWKIGKNWLWYALSAISAVVTLAFTLVYFFSRNEVIFRNQNAGLSGEEITWMADSWVAANWIRLAIMTVGFLAALNALSLSRREFRN